MKERPILFSAPMVRALLAGTKTQTRRVLKVQPVDVLPMEGDKAGIQWVGLMERDPAKGLIFHCRLGQPGDRLWVRENGWERPERSPRDMREGADTWPPYEYDAAPVSTLSVEDLKAWKWKRRPSIHMPRWASRITLEVVAVRVERLQDISEADAQAEGVERIGAQFADFQNSGPNFYTVDLGGGFSFNQPTAKECYAALWDQINGPGSWEANPWVWVVESKRITT